MPSVLGESALGPLRGIPRDGDGDGLIYDGTAKEQKVPRSPALPQHQLTGFRPFGDSTVIRGRIMDRVREAASAIPPVTNQRHTLTLEHVGYEGATQHGINDWKKAILSGKSLGTRLRGTWVLRDNNTGAVVDHKRSTVATVPYLTDHGTFIQNGSEYTLSHQLRLRPGVFTRVQANGELEAHVNVMPGKGLAHRIFMEPETGIFRLKVGQSKMPLTSLLRAMGATDGQLRAAWGDLYQPNMLKDDPSVIDKLHDKLVRKPDPTKTPEQEVRESFEAMGLDPEVTKRTLGKPYDHVSLDQMLDTTKKLVAVSKGEAEPDDRDHLAYMTALGPEDLLAERVGKDRMLLGKLLWKASMTGGLKHIQPEVLTRGIHAAIMSSGLGQPTEGINPAMIFDQQARVSRLGVGGIPCYSADTEVLTREGWKEWPAIGDNDELACRIDGHLEFRKPGSLHSAHYAGPMLRGSTDRVDYLVTPDHRMFVASYTIIDGKHGYAEWAARTASNVHGKRVRHKIAIAAYFGGKSPATYTIGPAPVEGSNRANARMDDLVVSFDDWVDFLACYLADGSFSYSTLRREYRLEIGKRRSKNPVEHAFIANLLIRLGFTHHYEQDRRFVVAGKHLAHYMSKFGKAADKFIPRYVMEANLDSRIRFFETLTTMDNSGKTASRRLYASASLRLAEQVGQLAIGLGYSVTYRTYRKPGENPQYQVMIRTADEAVVMLQKERDQYEVVDYDGIVYCASVPGSLLFVRRNGKTLWCGNSLDAIPAEARNVQPSHFGLIDPLVTPESLHVGVDSRVTQATLKGDDGRLYSPFRNVKTGQMEHRSAQDLAEAVIAFPGELKTLKPLVSALIGSKIRDVPRSQVQYELPSMDDAFSSISNLVPMKSTVKGQREVMAGRMLTQALPVRDPQAPLVQAGVLGSNNDSYESRYGKHMGALHSDVGGIVQHVDKDKGKITIKGDDGKVHEHELYVNYPYNRKTYIHQTPVVGPGDRVAPGGLLARSNYTDDKGVTAIGQNGRVAYIPFRGLNFEDAIVVSESMAKRMSSEHMYQHAIDIEDGVKTSKKGHLSTFPGVFDKQALDTIDDDGAVKPGTIVEYGSPLILAVKERERTHGAISRGRSASWSDHSETWKHHAPGEVTDIEKTPHGIVVSVKSLNPMEVGDKMSGRYGDKGVVAGIIPDHEMPHDGQGRPFEVLLNSLGIVTRTNPAQKIEAALGKVAEKTGQPYRVVDFDQNRDYNEWAIQELARHGMSSAETIHDPVAGRDIPRVLTGNRWFMKLHHTSESKAQGRGTGGYTAEGAPARGGEAGSKRISLMDINAVLSHGATEVLRDAGAVRGQQHPEFWQQFMSGHPMPTPKTPMIYDKFIGSLKAAGINVVREGTRLNIMALSNKDVDELSGNREVTHGDTVDWKSGLKPLPGGLFDESLTGGHGGNRWAHIKLAEPLPNPAMEEPIRRMLGLTKDKFLDVIAGKEQLGSHTGPGAIAKALDAINVPKAIEQARADIRSGRKGARDMAVRKLGYLKTLERLKMHPREWMLDKVPVLPPVFRPVSTMAGSKLPMVADANYLYKELIEARDNLRDMKGKLDDVSEERLATYQTFKAVTGLGDPIHPKNQERGVRGMLKQVFGNSPKTGMVQRKLLASATDLVGRASIVPNPDLDMDQVGLPESRAWDVYQPFIIRRLVRRGMSRIDAVRAVTERKPAAREAMVQEMDVRPVILNRAPVLHRYGIMAFRPRLEKGDTLHVSPLIVGGFNADFDGDAMQYHVPATDEAVKDAYEKMMPSRNLLSVSAFKAHQLPTREYAGGLYSASSTRTDRRPRVFATKADAIAAYRRGDINVDQPVEIVTDR